MIEQFLRSTGGVCEDSCFWPWGIMSESKEVVISPEPLAELSKDGDSGYWV